jgi:DNA-binding SARP family transcriptional activator
MMVRPGTWAAVLASAAVTLLVAGTGLSLPGSAANGPHLGGSDWVVFAALLAYPVVGAVLAGRRPGNPIGWLLLVVGLAFEFVCFSIGYTRYALFTHPGSLPGGAVIAALGDVSWTPLLVAASMVVLLFPTGRLASRRWRGLVALGLATSGLALIAQVLQPGPLGGSLSGVVNPFGVAGADRMLAAWGHVADAVAGPVLFGAALLSFVLRFRAAAGAGRLQLRWFAFAVVLMVAGFAAGDLLQGVGAPATVYSECFVLPLGLLPIAIGIAVLRHRLYGIELVIDRAAILACFAAVSTLVYLVALVAVGATVGRGTGSRVVPAVVATAIVAVAFQPILQRARRIGSRVAYGPRPAAAQARVAVRSLGAFRLFRDGVAVPGTVWQSKKARTLLKILIARRGRATPRPMLMEALWPEEDPGRLGNRLSVALATVRSVLDPDKRHPPDHFITADKDAVRLDLSRVSVDLEVFLRRAAEGLTLSRAGQAADSATALAEAESLYTGDFLEEDPYDDWATSAREEARATYLAVAHALAAASADGRDHDNAIRYYFRILDKDPWDEQAHLGLVAVLEMAGRHGEARRQYRSYTTAMLDLGLPATPFPA